MRKPSSSLLLLLPLLALVVVGFSPCGGEDKDSPTLNEPPRPQACKSLSELTPALFDAIRKDEVAGLRAVLDELNAPPAEGGTPYGNQVMQALFVALREFGQDPPETNATDGLCNELAAPPINQQNRLCSLRRLLKLYVHEGKASLSLHALDPVLAGVLDYVLGRKPAADKPHYEIARNLELMATTTGLCDPHDLFDLLQGITAYLGPARSAQFLANIRKLTDDPRILGPNGLLASLGGSADGGDPSAAAGFQLLTNQLLCTLLGIDPTKANPFEGLDKLMNDTVLPLVDSNFPPQNVPLPDGGYFRSDLRPALTSALGDLKGLLDPKLPEPVLQPLLKGLACMSTQQTGASLCGRGLRPGFVPMVYHLGFEAQVIGLDEILEAVDELARIDRQSETPGLVGKVAHDVVAALNRDEQSVEALSVLAATLFRTGRPCDDGAGNVCAALPLENQPTGAPKFAPLRGQCSSTVAPKHDVAPACRSNVENGIPVVADMLRDGAIDELLCAIDTLVYGCAGGVQPACQGPRAYGVDAGPTRTDGGALKPDGGR